MSEELRAEKCDWDSEFDKEDGEANKKSGNSKSFPKAEFMSFKEEKTYKVRLIGSLVKFRRWWKPYKAITHESLRDQDPAWKAGWFPKRRYAINVIDRSDGKLKIMEQGPTVFQAFYDYREARSIDPAGKDGPDWSITVKIPKNSDGVKNPMDKDYAVVALDKAPLTQEEKKMLCKCDENGNILKGEDGKAISNLWNLQRIFKPTAISKMQEMWVSLSDEAKVPPKRKTDKKDEDGEGDDKTDIKEPEIKQPEENFTPEVEKKDDADSSELF
jgi:hypothetical protein